MLQFLIIVLDDSCPSFCYYPERPIQKIMELSVLKKGILFAMKQNLMIQVIYPNYDIPEEYKQEIEKIDHVNIASYTNEYQTNNLVIYSNIQEMVNAHTTSLPSVLRTTKKDLFANYIKLESAILSCPHLNISITDIDTFTESDFVTYGQILNVIGNFIACEATKKFIPQLNLLTDRIFLTSMNNCNSGVSTISLCPNGKFYVCPGFYYDDKDLCVGDVDNGLTIKNQYLYRIDKAPICRRCDAYQCKRCIWLNKKTTLEVNTPSHEQCVVSHIERNASRDLSFRLKEKIGLNVEIKELDYLDPFDKVRRDLK